MSKEEKVNAENNSTSSRTIGGIQVHNITKDSFQMKKIRWSEWEISLYIGHLPEYIALIKKYENGEISEVDGNIELDKIYAEYDDQFYSYY